MAELWHELEDFLVDLKASFFYCVPYEFLFCEKHLGDFSVALKALCIWLDTGGLASSGMLVLWTLWGQDPWEVVAASDLGGGSRCRVRIAGCSPGLSPASCCFLDCAQKLKSRRWAWLSSWVSPSQLSAHSFPEVLPGSWQLTWPTRLPQTHWSPAGQERKPYGKDSDTWVHSVDRIPTEIWFLGPSHLSVRAYGSQGEVMACLMFYTATQCQKLWCCQHYWSGKLQPCLWGGSGLVVKTERSAD